MIIVPKGRAPSGWIMARSDMETLANSDSPALLQASLRNAIDKFDAAESDDVYDSKRLAKELAKKAGKKSYSFFLKDAALVEIAISSSEVILQPLRSSKSFKGLESYRDITERLPLSSLEDESAVKRVISLLEEIQQSYGD